MTGIEEAAALGAMATEAGAGAAAAGGLGAAGMGLGADALGAGLGADALGAGAGLTGADLGGMLGASGAAGELGATSSGIGAAGGAANPFSLALGNFNSMYPGVGTGMQALNKARMAQGLLGMGQPTGGGPRPIPQSSMGAMPVQGASQTIAPRFNPNQMPQVGGGMTTAGSLTPGAASPTLDPYTLMLLRQAGVMQ